MSTLDDDERRCLDSHVDLLRDHFGSRLDRVELFGSAARKDMWARHQPFRSDIDVLTSPFAPTSTSSSSSTPPSPRPGQTR